MVVVVMVAVVVVVIVVLVVVVVVIVVVAVAVVVAVVVEVVVVAVVILRSYLGGDGGDHTQRRVYRRSYPGATCDGQHWRSEGYRTDLYHWNESRQTLTSTDTERTR